MESCQGHKNRNNLKINRSHIIPTILKLLINNSYQSYVISTQIALVYKSPQKFDSKLSSIKPSLNFGLSSQMNDRPTVVILQVEPKSVVVYRLNKN